jgi:hypothetical protein
MTNIRKHGWEDGWTDAHRYKHANLNGLLLLVHWPRAGGQIDKGDVVAVSASGVSSALC